MLSKTKISWINSLERKKNRDEERLFVAEGKKTVFDLISLMKCRFIAVTSDEFAIEIKKHVQDVEVLSMNEYKKISFQKSPQGILAVFEQPVYDWNIDDISKKLNLALDDIQDPGNLGTIIRIADWFGIQDIFCSLHTADVFNPKTVQATMGAIGRVRVHYVDLPVFLSRINGISTVYGTCMDGKNIYDNTLKSQGIIVMGNEGNGISENVMKYVSEKLLIPNYPIGNQSTESLNVGIATAVTIAEFRRRQF